MTSSVFSVGGYYELLALHRALLEAKFCDEPNDNDVSGSPTVASLHRQLVDVLIEAESERKGEDARSSWVKWLALSSDRREWKVALDRARSEPQWDGWTEEDRLSYAEALLSPFSVPDDLLAEFIRCV